MKLIGTTLALGTTLLMVGCQTMTPEQKAQMEADARLCAENGMLVAESFGYYSCHPMPSDHELQRYLLVESACVARGGNVSKTEIGGALGTPSYTKVYGCWGGDSPEQASAPVPTNCRTTFHGNVAKTQCL